MDQIDDFDAWLVAMDDKLEQLMDELPVEVSEALDYSPASLSVLEGWLLQNFATMEAVVEKDRYLLDRLSCYVGETYRRALGGQWTVDFSDPDNVFCGLPILVNDVGGHRCPLTLVTASLDRRRGNYWETILQNSLNG